MFISRLTLKTEVGQIQLLKKMSRNKYRLHQLLWNLFEGGSTRKNEQGKQFADFIYRADYPEKQLLINLVSGRKPINRDGIWNIDTKPYIPKIEQGQLLQFYLRVNPTITLCGRNKNQRHDVLMHAKHRLTEEMLKVEGRKPDRDEKWQAMLAASKEWLIKREQHIGATIDSSHLILDNHQQERVATESKEKIIHYSTIDYQGILTVDNVEKFKNTLLFGIGKSKAFGCGLMVIRRI